MFSYILLFLLIYILYRFITGFLLPVIKATRDMQQKMRNTNNNMNGNFGNPAEPVIKKPRHGAASHTEQKPSSKDYIDFEEIKK